MSFLILTFIPIALTCIVLYAFDVIANFLIFTIGELIEKGVEDGA